MKLKKDKKGFSLIELIVVIAIISILVALLAPQVSGYVEKANKTAAQALARSVYTEAMNQISGYYMDQTIFGEVIDGENFDISYAKNSLEEPENYEEAVPGAEEKISLIYFNFPNNTDDFSMSFVKLTMKNGIIAYYPVSEEDKEELG